MVLVRLLMMFNLQELLNLEVFCVVFEESSQDFNVFELERFVCNFILWSCKNLIFQLIMCMDQGSYLNWDLLNEIIDVQNVEDLFQQFDFIEESVMIFFSVIQLIFKSCMFEYFYQIDCCSCLYLLICWFWKGSNQLLDMILNCCIVQIVWKYWNVMF